MKVFEIDNSIFNEIINVKFKKTSKKSGTQQTKNLFS